MWDAIKDKLWLVFHTEVTPEPQVSGVGPAESVHIESNDINDVLNPDGTVKT